MTILQLTIRQRFANRIFEKADYIKLVTIGECLESVINQTRKPDEVIIVDDSSTDDSAEICKSYI